MHIISFSRSRQHLIQRLLNQIYIYYKKEFTYCEYYSCCQKVPCAKNNEFQKNHDFNMNLFIPPEDKFIVLYRSDKIKQYESYFRLSYFKKEIGNVNLNYNYEELFKRLINFIQNNSNYYNNFVKKYITSNTYKNLLIIEYDDFIQNFKDYIKKIIIYLDIKKTDDDICADEENIIIIFEKIEYKNRLNEHIYEKVKKIIEE
jgi:hypothetical protein